MASLTFSAHAYNIKHSYSTPSNATEYYGQCSNGGQLKVVEDRDGRFSYDGPAGRGTINSRSLDAAAKAACGE
jgi:hypothetical protein